MSGLDSEIERMREAVAPVASKHGVKRMYLFGSRAGGGGFADGSDRGFCIEPGDIHGMLCPAGFMTGLEGALDTEADIVFERPLGPDFAETMSKERKLVYESAT
ncbi:MAG: nucleotidyltransferase domain-containing protein [Candidatus Methanoplasma sp.]|jgi:predicted nucleotidyltransferase|nr:nucleotidyltransferase domain-containing protein [Candidatus Methanoplasma sp.]